MTKLSSILKSALFFATLAMMSAQSFALELKCPCLLDYYAGIDLQGRRMPFKKGFGDHAFKHRLSQELNFFTGVKLNDYIAIEAGYESSDNESDIKIIPSENIVFGTHINPRAVPDFIQITSVVDTRSKIDGLNINLVGLLPVPIENHNISLIGALGLSSLRSKTECYITDTANAVFTLNDPFEPIPIQRVINTASLYKKRVNALRISTGVQFITSNPSFGIRTLITWENTHRIKIKGIDMETKKPVMEYAKFKDSIIYRMGFFVPF